MKKVMLIAILTVALLSCKSDDDSSNTDCFDCTTNGNTNQYCHTDGDNFFTLTSAGQSVEVEFQEGQTWAIYKASIQTTCE